MYVCENDKGENDNNNKINITNTDSWKSEVKRNRSVVCVCVRLLEGAYTKRREANEIDCDWSCGTQISRQRFRTQIKTFNSSRSTNAVCFQVVIKVANIAIK